MKLIERRLAALEQRKSVKARQMHIIKATDHGDSVRQISEMVAAGGANDGDGFLCLTGATDLLG